MSVTSIIQTPVSRDDPLMIAFAEYKSTEESATTKKWAASQEYVEGSLWAAFVQGWDRRNAADKAFDLHKVQTCSDEVFEAMIGNLRAMRKGEPLK